MEETDSLIDSMEFTIKREVLEEVGVEIKDNMKYVESNYFISKLGNYVLDVVFLCEYNKGKPEIQNKEEVAEILMLSTEDVVMNSNTPEWTKRSILKASRMLLQ